MTQEQTVRNMLQSFVDDPPDCAYQEGFMDALHIVANEVLGIEWNDPLFQKIDAMGRMDSSIAAIETLAKVKPVLGVIVGGKSDPKPI